MLDFGIPSSPALGTCLGSFVTLGIQTGQIGVWDLTPYGDVRRVIVSPLSTETQRWTFSTTGQVSTITSSSSNTGQPNEVVIRAGGTTTHNMFNIDFISPDTAIKSIGVRNNGSDFVTGAVYLYNNSVRAINIGF